MLIGRIPVVLVVASLLIVGACADAPPPPPAAPPRAVSSALGELPIVLVGGNVSRTYGDAPICSADHAKCDSLSGQGTLMREVQTLLLNAGYNVRTARVKPTDPVLTVSAKWSCGLSGCDEFIRRFDVTLRLEAGVNLLAEASGTRDELRQLVDSLTGSQRLARYAAQFKEATFTTALPAPPPAPAVGFTSTPTSDGSSGGRGNGVDVAAVVAGAAQVAGEVRVPSMAGGGSHATVQGEHAEAHHVEERHEERHEEHEHHAEEHPRVPEHEGCRPNEVHCKR